MSSRLSLLVDRLWSPVTSLAGVRKRLLLGVLWTLVSTVGSRGLAVAAGAVTARLLGREGLGEFGMIQSSVGMFGVFAGFGLGVTATKHVAELRMKDPLRTGRIIDMSLVLAMISGGAASLVLAVSAPFLAQWTISAPHLALQLRIAAALLLIEALAGAQVGALSGLEAFRRLAGVNLVQGLFALPVTVLAVWLWGLTGAVWSLVVSAAVRLALNRRALVSECRARDIVLPGIWRKETLGEWRRICGFSLPATLSAMMVGPVLWGANALLVDQPGGYGELGILSATLQWRALVLFLPSNLGQVLLPILCAERSTSGSRVEAANVLLPWMLGTFVALPLMCLPELTQWLYGPEFAGVGYARAMTLVMFCACILSYKDGLARVLVAADLMWWCVLSNSVWATILIPSTVYLRRWGAGGVAGALALAYLLNTVVFVPLYVSRKLCPRELMLSRAVLVMWAIIAALAAATLLGLPVAIRLVCLAAGLVCLGLISRGSWTTAHGASVHGCRRTPWAGL